MQCASFPIDAGHGNGRSARTAKGLMAAFHQQGWSQVGICVEHADGFARSEAGFVAMTEAIGHQNRGAKALLLHTPTVAANLLSFLGDAHGAHAQPGASSRRRARLATPFMRQRARTAAPFPGTE